MARPVIAVVGPTASGKSRLAQDIALRYGGEVVSADSMQVYKGMDIGTGKLKASERKVVHHGLDLLEPNAPYSVALYQGFARECFRQIDSRGNYAILCGGSGFYVRAALDDYEFPSGEQSENPLREHYRRIAKEKGSFALWELLKDADAQSAELIHPNNVRRVIRAFELLAEGKSYSGQLSQLAHIVQAVPAVFLGLSVEPEILRGRIGKRVDAMIEEGLLGEVETLLAGGFRKGITSLQAIGYKELVGVIDGQTSLEEAIESIKTASCRYAKRQRSWFGRDPRILWLNADSGDSEDILCQACGLLDTILPDMA